MEHDQPRDFWQACHQTPDIDIFVSPDLSKVSMREGFLGRRPSFLQARIDHSHKLGPSDDVTLGGVSWETFCTFWEWSYTKEPQISRSASLDEVLDLGIMATKYQVQALQHEASDLLRQSTGRKNWKLGPSQVIRMLSCDSESPWLRQLVYASLCTIARPQGINMVAEAEEWVVVMERHPGLAMEWKRSDLLGLGHNSITDGGPCRFHDHGPGQNLEGNSKPCPYQQSELYPVVEERQRYSRKSNVRRKQKNTSEFESIVAKPYPEIPNDGPEEVVAEEPVMIEDYI